MESILLHEKQTQLEDLKSKIKTLFHESLKFNSFELQGVSSTDVLGEKVIACCNCHCHLKKCDAETQTFETDFEGQELTSTHSALDWLIDNNGKTTVGELVQDAVAEQQTLQNDYIYNEEYQMYYSQSTGYYYDSERNLFYEPYSQTYYKYNDETNSYDIYYHTDLTTAEHTKESSPKRNDSGSGRVLHTKKHRKKRSKKKKSNVVETEVLQGNQVEENFEKKDLEKAADDVNCPSDSSLEEGEIVSDSSYDASPQNPDEEYVPYSPASGQFEESSNEKWPPCIRAVIKESTHQKIGSLILITCDGGVIGREKDSSICLPDMSVSREHAQVTFDNDTWQYSITDLNSQNSTFVNDCQISDDDNANCHQLNHGDILRLGSCKLLIHIHEGNNTCKDCEPGVIQAELDEATIKPIAFKTKEEKELERRNNVKQMKIKFGLKDMNFTPAQKLPKVYQDRSEQRRKEKGSLNPYEKTEQPVSLETSLPVSNKGYKMLKSMGWSEGQKLGLNGSGLSEPVSFHYQSGYSGFGSIKVNSALNIEAGSKSRRRQWEKLAERYRKAVGSTEKPTVEPSS